MEVLLANENDLNQLTHIYIKVFSTPPRNEVLDFNIN